MLAVFIAGLALPGAIQTDVEAPQITHYIEWRSPRKFPLPLAGEG
ncbi:MAG: hypothetical protein NUV63_04295 [Gallionella sp.]|nr:hypothetical protein [Gallionella sp.]